MTLTKIVLPQGLVAQRLHDEITKVVTDELLDEVATFDGNEQMFIGDLRNAVAWQIRIDYKLFKDNLIQHF
jgi:hypothetical protein